MEISALDESGEPVDWWFIYKVPQLSAGANGTESATGYEYVYYDSTFDEKDDRDPDKKVSLNFERTSSDLVITIRDQGKGLDPAKIPDPLAPENLLKTSGRGIFLIRSFMDDVQIKPSTTGTEIKLIKHVHGPAADGKEASQ